MTPEADDRRDGEAGCEAAAPAGAERAAAAAGQSDPPSGWVARHPALAFVLLVQGAVWGVLLPALMSWPDRRSLATLEPFLGFTPLLAALVVRGLSGRLAAEGFLPRLHAGAGLRWYILALLVFPALGLAALGIRFLTDGVLPSFSPRPVSEYVLFSIALFLLPGLAEEPGWRGLLQAELQDRLGAFGSSLVVGIVWGTWHSRDRLLHPERFHHAGLGWFLLLIVAASVIIGWLFARASNSLLVAMTAHFGANVVFFYLPIFVGEDGGTAWLYTGLVCGTAILVGIVGVPASAAEPRAEAAGVPRAAAAEDAPDPTSLSGPSRGASPG